MNKRIASLIVIAITALASFGANTQTDTNAPPVEPPTKTSILQDFAAGALSATNWSVAPYGTYAPNAPDTKVGGGALLTYEVSKYIGAGIGIDWLGHFSMTSGNVQLKDTFRPVASWTNFTVTPFGIAAIGLPFGGAGTDNGSIATITGGGIGFHILQIKNVSLDLGYAAVYWQGAGQFSGLRHEGFLALHLN